MPLQKRKKKNSASDKSAKQVVTQVVKVNIGDTKPKKRRKRKSSGGGVQSVASTPMLAQVPQQQFIYPPQPFPQELPMAPPRPSAPSIEVPNPVPVPALNRVLGSVPRSTLAVPQEVPRPTLQRAMSEQIRPTSFEVPTPPMKPVDKPVESQQKPVIAKLKLTGAEFTQPVN